MWKEIDAAPADAIFGLNEAFREDNNPNKVNLAVGVYKDEKGQTPIMESVRQAERVLLEKESSKTYLPISGDPEYDSEVQKLVFGETSEVVLSGRAATVQTPGGTGGLRVGADLLHRFLPKATVWISDPTWANHKGVFTAAGFTLKSYPYYDAERKCIDFAQMKECLAEIPAGDIVLLHGCCHNPSGFDPDAAQWREIAEIAARQGWMPFIDFAYQGFGDGLDEDRTAVNVFADTGVNFCVANSFSKNFGLYTERVGALSVVTANSEEMATALSHMKTVIRVNFSNPPAHGALVVKTILKDAALRQQWQQELTAMRNRIREMRGALVDGLVARGVTRDFSYINQQKGMFSFSGLSPEMVHWLRQEKGIYMVGAGRINAAGLSHNNIDYVCDSIAEGLQKQL